MLTAEEKRTLMQVAQASVDHGLQHGQPLAVEPGDYTGKLAEPGASFVTLNMNGELRGCIGTLEAWRPLISDVAENAFNAAFRDPRFAPLSARERDQLEFHISVLNPAEEMQFDSEADLIGQLRPGIDGLILSDRGRRGTFLPSVWESLPEPQAFLQHLKLKAGLPGNYWSDTLRVERYTVEEFGDEVL